MPDKTLSQTPAAIASRKRRADVAAAKKTAAGDPPAADPAGDPPEPSTATIGVQSPAKPAAKAAQLYHCPNCDADVTMAMPECPTCGQVFNWPSAS